MLECRFHARVPSKGMERLAQNAHIQQYRIHVIGRKRHPLYVMQAFKYVSYLAENMGL